MKNWTIDRLKELVADGIEESSQLEYKRAASLVKNDDNKKADIVKQVAAMANAAGGTIIYGIAEFNEKEKRHLPEKLDPVDRTETSREWLDSIIQSIQPRINGVLIHPIADDADTNKAFYVVEVPASHTAHQARDHVYYKRRNFQLLPMEDYEVRDVMHRKSHPQIKASILINKSRLHRGKKGKLLLKLENIGTTICQQYMAVLEVPVSVNGNLWFGEDVQIRTTGNGASYWHVSLSQNIRKTPLFPGATLILSEEFSDGSGMVAADDSRIISTDKLTVSIYADEMPAIRSSIPIDAICEDWIEINPREGT